MRWYLSKEASVEGVMYFSPSKQLALGEFSAGQVNIVKTWKDKRPDQNKRARKARSEQEKLTLFERIIPVAKAKEDKIYYGLDRDEEESRSVYKVDFANKTVDLFYETGAFEIIDIVQSDDREFIGVQVVKNGARAYEYLSEDEQKSQKNITEKSRLDTIIDRDASDTVHIVYREAHNTPGYYSLVNAAKKIDTIIAYDYPQLHGKLHSDIIEGSYQAADMEIPFLLNLPQKTERALPLVVMPHGGPIGVHDDPYYDPIVQYLVNLGYAVLRVNFRGSSGHSAALKDAGKQQWGNKMLSDIHGAAGIVASRSDIDKTKICTVGFSYGGYAAATLLAQHPDFYRCGVSISGVSDINLHINDSDNESRRAWYVEHVGNPETQYEALKAVSPAYMTERIKVPLLIGHGTQDKTVDVEHSYRLALMMKKHNKEYELYIDEESGHQFSDLLQRQKLFAAITRFLGKAIAPES